MITHVYSSTQDEAEAGGLEASVSLITQHDPVKKYEGRKKAGVVIHAYHPSTKAEGC